MSRIFLQFFLSLYLFFAISRVYQRYKGQKLGVFGLVFWLGIFGLGILGVLFPDLTVTIANWLGIGRGADFIVYISIVILFYLVFRLYAFIEDVKSDLTEIIREMAIKNPIKKGKND